MLLEREQSISSPTLNTTLFLTLIFATGAATSSLSSTMSSSASVTSSPAQRALTMLHQVMAEDHNWIGIHAAEALVSCGQEQAVRQRFLSEVDQASAKEHRVGIWRVLAATASSAEERSKWTTVIEATFLDAQAPDRKQAIESLAKLGHPVTGHVLAAVQKMASTPPPMNTVLPIWSLHHSGDSTALPRLIRLLRSDDSVARQRAAYALRWIKPAGAAVRVALTEAIDSEPAGAPRLFLLSAALTLDADPARRAEWQGELEDRFFNGTAARYETGLALASLCTPADLPRLVPLLEDADHDTRVAAATIVLRVSARSADAAKVSATH